MGVFVPPLDIYTTGLYMCYFKTPEDLCVNTGSYIMTCGVLSSHGRHRARTERKGPGTLATQTEVSLSPNNARGRGGESSESFRGAWRSKPGSRKRTLMGC
ncbi:hypothetical protein Taro_025942 [Colocasia esculenta]|uniref:Uncharacterized protein n=1 Tax=Colocasia esculenta TaxID=4460 RepID=A0A843VPS9_COLES|nr:hypothetical protein [Colocasia esculenta]